MKYLIIVMFLLIPDFCFSFDYETGGHFRLFGSSSFYEDDHLIKESGIDNSYFDLSSNLRIKSNFFFSERLNLDIHYEVGCSGGDTRRAVSKIDPYFSSYFSLEKSDKRKLFNLSSYTNSDDREYFHKLDRFSIKYSSDLSSISIGRQAVSTGNGLIFNPMDILNPFAPSDVVKDYKAGTDIALFQFSKGLISDGSVIYVPRRDENGDIDSKESSYAIKLKSFFEEIEAGIFYAKHFNDDVIGLSGSGFAGSAAWRSDILWTKIDSTNEYGYFSGILNFDYSWVINGKNWYGLIEFYYSGIGEKDLKDALIKEELLKRIKRGELYNSATKYIGLTIQNEIHPLINLYLTSMINMDDYSYLVQPGAKWSALENLEILIGADFYFGGDNTEFKGYDIPIINKSTGPANKLYIQGTYYF